MWSWVASIVFERNTRMKNECSVIATHFDGSKTRPQTFPQNYVFLSKITRSTHTLIHICRIQMYLKHAPLTNKINTHNSFSISDSFTHSLDAFLNSSHSQTWSTMAFLFYLERLHLITTPASLLLYLYCRITQTRVLQKHDNLNTILTKLSQNTYHVLKNEHETFHAKM